MLKISDPVSAPDRKIITYPAKPKSFRPDHIRINNATKMILTRWGIFKKGSFMDPDTDPH
jgi:LmbE family N-acetylglucosaminyl deacetylase